MRRLSLFFVLMLGASHGAYAASTVFAWDGSTGTCAAKVFKLYCKANNTSINDYVQQLGYGLYCDVLVDGGGPTPIWKTPSPPSLYWWQPLSGPPGVWTNITKFYGVGCHAYEDYLMTAKSIRDFKPDYQPDDEIQYLKAVHWVCMQ